MHPLVSFRLALASVATTLLPPLPAQQPTVSLAETVDRLFRRCDRPDVPGGVVLVGRGDEIVLQKAYGSADLERGVPLGVDSVLDIGSTSKQFTATCVLLLAAPRPSAASSSSANRS